MKSTGTPARNEVKLESPRRQPPVPDLLILAFQLTVRDHLAQPDLELFVADSSNYTSPKKNSEASYEYCK